MNRAAQALRTEMLKPGMKVGLFGGSFDPPHEGHLHVARTALARLRLDRVWWLVSPGNPLKAWKPGEYARRLEAVSRLADAPRMVVSDMELRLDINRTADVIEHLTDHHPGVRFVWIMGSDSLKDFHRWGRWQDIAWRVPICVVARPGDSLKARLSPAARRLASRRLPEGEAAALAMAEAPRWTYLTEPLHPAASTELRRAPRPGARPQPMGDLPA